MRHAFIDLGGQFAGLAARLRLGFGVRHDLRRAAQSTGNPNPSSPARNSDPGKTNDDGIPARVRNAW
jgi:hypothetical protein